MDESLCHPPETITTLLISYSQIQNKRLKKNERVKLEEFFLWGFPGGSVVKKSPAGAGVHGFDPWAMKISWKRKWHPTPVFLPGKSHGQRSLAGCSPWGHKSQI